MLLSIKLQLLTLANVIFLDLITELKSFMHTSGSTGGDGSTENTLSSGDFDFHGGVATRIKDLASVNLRDRHN